MKSKGVLGIDFFKESFPSLLTAAEACWQSNTRLRIATLNPEFLVAAQRNLGFKTNLQKAEKRVVDGFGLWAVLHLQGWRGERIVGAQLTEALLQKAEQEHRSVLVVLKKEGLSSVEKTRVVLEKKYPGLTVAVKDDSQVNTVAADLTLIATGIPDQEYRAEQIVRGVVMGVGGSIDFLTGAQKRAPIIFQKLGIEWLWRLILQPKRLKRIWNAVIVFPILVILDKKRAGTA